MAAELARMREAIVKSSAELEQVPSAVLFRAQKNEIVIRHRTTRTLRIFSRWTMLPQVRGVLPVTRRSQLTAGADTYAVGSRLHHTTPDLGLSSETQSDNGIDVDDLPPQV